MQAVHLLVQSRLIIRELFPLESIDSILYDCPLTNDVVVYALLIRIGNGLSLLFGLVKVLMFVAGLMLLCWNCQRRYQESEIEKPVDAHDCCRR